MCTNFAFDVYDIRLIPPMSVLVNKTCKQHSTVFDVKHTVGMLKFTLTGNTGC